MYAINLLLPCGLQKTKSFIKKNIYDRKSSCSLNKCEQLHVIASNYMIFSRFFYIDL